MDFVQLLKDKKIVLLDGAMGTQLDKKGLMGRGTANLDTPQAVLEVHRMYAEAGCDALITNTLTMNPTQGGHRPARRGPAECRKAALDGRPDGL